MKRFTTLAALLVGFSATTAQAQSGPDPLDFALTLYRKAAALDPGANALVSPYSARQAVGLAYIEKSARESLASADPKTTVEAANSLWLRSDWTFLDSYVARARDGFDDESPPFVFIADRPFLFAIEDTVTGTILFIGSVQDPR